MALSWFAWLSSISPMLALVETLAWLCFRGHVPWLTRFHEMLPGMVPASDSHRTQIVGIFETRALCCPFRQTQSPMARVSSYIFPPVLICPRQHWVHGTMLANWLWFPFCHETPRASRLLGQDLHMEQLWACKHVTISTIFFLGTLWNLAFLTSPLPSLKAPAARIVQDSGLSFQICCTLYTAFVLTVKVIEAWFVCCVTSSLLERKQYSLQLLFVSTIVWKFVAELWIYTQQININSFVSLNI